MDVVVVGAGPNGLTAALVLASAGLQVEVYESAATVGGGTRTAELTLPGYRHDVCSAAHPMALASPFFRAFDLAAHGVDMLQPEVAYAHPLDGGRAGLAWRSVDATADGLGGDRTAWRRLLGPLVTRWQGLVDVGMSDLRSLPAAPLTAAQLGMRVLEQASPFAATRFRGPVAPAMLAGVGAHAIAPLTGPAAGGVTMLLAALAHAVGWPIPRGGSQTIADAMAAALRRYGARVVTNRRIDSLAELPRARAILFDTAPAEFLRIAGDRLPSRYARQLARFRHGGGGLQGGFRVGWSRAMVGARLRTRRHTSPGRFPAGGSHRGTRYCPWEACRTTLRPRRAAWGCRPHKGAGWPADTVDLRPRTQRLPVGRQRSRRRPGGTLRARLS